jgi:very-short-patch-repair endonuclease
MEQSIQGLIHFQEIDFMARGDYNKSNTEEFIKKANVVHKSFYDYSKTVYKCSKDKVIITCPIHGDFQQMPNGHLSGYGCQHCAHIICRKSRILTLDHFISKANTIHNNFYDYSKFVYQGARLKGVIICPLHGEFEQIADGHLRGLVGCAFCRNNQIQSKGGKRISKWLESKNIEYIPEKTFVGCKNILNLYFDFYLPKYNLCIEYDGEQHFPFRNFGKFFGGKEGYAKIVKNDAIKTNYCKDNNINLLRIPYWNIENIDIILENTILQSWTSSLRA